MCGNYSASFRAGAAGVQPERLGHIQGKETSPVLASVILSKAKNPFLCRRHYFLFVQKVSKDTTWEGEDSESLPPPRSPSPHSNGQKGVPFWIPPADGKPGRENDNERARWKDFSIPGRAEALPGAVSAG